MTSASALKTFLVSLGIAPRQHILLHASFRRIRGEFPEVSIGQLLSTLQELVTPNGSIIVPTFTYCFKQQTGPSRAFIRTQTPSAVGSVSDFFWRMPDVVRTSSPTHSFGLWGDVAWEITSDNNPASPLGKGSVLDWLAHNAKGRLLLLGTDFSSLSFGHYLEIIARVPWLDYSPWPKGDFLNVGVSATGEIELGETPRCSKQFVALEEWMRSRGTHHTATRGALVAHLMPVDLLLSEGVAFFTQHPERLLCPAGSCDLCDLRRDRFLGVGDSKWVE